MKNYARVMGMMLLSATLVVTACTGKTDTNNSLLLLTGGGGTPVVLVSATQTGGVPGTTDSTGLTLAFDVDPTSLTADNITVTGATKGALTGTGTTRSLGIPDITVLNGETVSVAITSPTGYSLSGSPQTAVVYRAPVAVVFQSAAQTGGVSGTTDSTGLTLTFDVDPTTLTADNITVTGATKGALTGTGTTRSLGISDITVLNGETVSVAITSPTGYSLSGSPQTAVVYRPLAAVAFQSAEQTGGVSGTADSTGLTLTFDVDPTTLTADNIIVTGATKGTLTGTGMTRSLEISDITVANGATVSVTITSPAGYSISGSPRTAVVYRSLTAGMNYLGGKIAYILSPGDPGYDASVPHGLIVSVTDLGNVVWALTAYQATSVPGGTGTDLGTGSANTDKIIAQNGVGSDYAAGLARAYNGGGYTDWYLPSQTELLILSNNRSLFGGLEADYYWSSSEYSPNRAYFMLDISVQGSVTKPHLYRVRAVRSF